MPTRWLLSILTTVLISWAIRRWGTLAFLSLGGVGFFSNTTMPDMGNILQASTPEEAVSVANPALPNYFRGKVVRIVDGDTIDVVPNDKPNGRWHRIRLAGIDTPEKRGATACPGMAAIASDVLEDYIASRDYQVQVVIDKKIGQRWLGEVYTADDKSLRRLMLDSGQARVFFPGASKTQWAGCF